MSRTDLTNRLSPDELFKGLEGALDYPLPVGRVIAPDHKDFGDAIDMWNSRNKPLPPAVVQVQGVEDTQRVIRFARENDIQFTVRAGGHEVDGWGLQEGVIAIDLNRHNGVFVDRSRKRAVVQAGARLRKVDRETQAHGLGLTAGTVSDTGVAGLTLGGGFGYLQRAFGATVDNLVAVEGVSVNGDFVRASAEENPELFWGLKGGGGNFLVATSFEYDVHEFGPTVLTGSMIYAGDEVEPALKFWRDFMVDAPDEVGTMAVVQRANHLFPPEFFGQIVVTIMLVYVGDIAEGEEALRPMRSFGKPLADLVQPGLYRQLQSTFEMPGMPQRLPTHQKCGFVPVATDEYIETVIDVIKNAPLAERGEEDLVMIPISSMSGKIGRIPDDSAALPRGDGFYWEAVAINKNPDDDDKWIGYVDNEIERRLRPLGAPRAYLNHYSTSKGQEGQELIKWAYGEDKYKRLVALKDRWDPENVLRFNKNIAPSNWTKS